MTFVAPGFLYAAIAVAAAIAALHFLVTRQPRAAVLPTARFVPNLPATATSRAARPSDIVLLLLRVLLVFAAGAALAGPVLTPPRTREARVILADMSASVGDVEQVRDSVRSLYREGDLLIAFDSGARTIAGSVTDTLASLTASPARGNLSVALVSAIRAGSDLRERADSLELVIVSPFAEEEWDAATDSIRTLWPGRARIIRAGVPADTLSRRRVAMTLRMATNESSAFGAAVLDTETTGTTENDPLNATALLSGSERPGEVRLVRDDPTAEDTQWVIANDRVLVAWPRAARPPGAVPRARDETNASPSAAGGVISGSSVVIATFERTWKFPADSLAGATVIARWIDGEPAAIERTAGRGCTRSVAIPVTPTGDLAIRPEFIRLMKALTAPCRTDARSAPVTASKLVSLAGTGGFAPRDAFRTRAGVKSSLARWLFGLALAAAIAELFIRGRGDQRDRRKGTSREAINGLHSAHLQETQS